MIGTQFHISPSGVLCGFEQVKSNTMEFFMTYDYFMEAADNWWLVHSLLWAHQSFCVVMYRWRVCNYLWLLFGTADNWWLVHSLLQAHQVFFWHFLVIVDLTMADKMKQQRGKAIWSSIILISHEDGLWLHLQTSISKFICCANPTFWR